MKKILLVGSQHGNELLGDALMAHIRAHRRDLLPAVTFVIGNIRAKKAGVRFIESDLNRSFTGGRTTYEERRATRLLKFIKQGDFDLVLDLHTTTCDQPPCLIVPGVEGPILPFLQASSMERIVHMRHSFNRTALTGACPAAVAVEVNNRSLTHLLLNQLCDDISRFLRGTRLSHERTVFVVDELLAKVDISDRDAKKLRNFEISEHGFTPVLVGDNSYKKLTDYLGFKAHKVYKTGLQEPATIVVVCRGNIARSPFAAAIITQQLARRNLGHKLRVVSRGVQGSSVDPEPVKHPNITHYRLLYRECKPALDFHGVDLSGHHSTVIDSDVAAKATVLLAMDITTKKALQLLFPAQSGKIHLFSELAGAQHDVADPENMRNSGGCRQIFEEINSTITKGLPRLLALAESEPGGRNNVR